MASDEEGGSSDNGGETTRVPLNEEEDTFQPAPVAPTPREKRRARMANFTFSLKSSTAAEEGSRLGSMSSTRGMSSPPELRDVEAGGGAPTPAAAAAPTSPIGIARRSIFRGGLAASHIRRPSDDPQPRRSSAASGDSARSETGSSASFGSGNGTGGERGRGAHKRSTFRLPLFSTGQYPSSTNMDDLDRFGRGASDAGSARMNNGRSTVRSRIAITYRRYGVGDYVLISNHDCDEDAPIHLVNRYGYPEWGGGATTSEERRGPYIYLLAQVVSVHFGEDAQYYTVKREDNLEYQRADAEWMEPINDQDGIDAAKLAAKKKEQSEDVAGSNVRGQGFWCLRPCTGWMTNSAHRSLEWGKELYRKTKMQTDACLNGNRPYGISCRFTGVNFLVLCSIWYLYIDQLRLAFMPHTSDYACAVVSAIVWTVLFLELALEVFIRPTGYRALIKSDRAYLPATVRYLNTFHLVSELVGLIFFVPEFMCLFSYKSCGDRFSFSLANACLMSLYGPDRLHAFYGTAFICLLRLRIFGLVRHWTKMWTNNTFVRIKGKNGEWRVQRGKGFLVPQGHNRGGRARGEVIAMEESVTQQLLPTEKGVLDASVTSFEVKTNNEFTDDYHLTNASKIGTALFMTNAQRGLLFVFLIGLAPLIGVSFYTNGGINTQLVSSVELLQSNNLVLNSTDSTTCGQLRTTVLEWVKTNAFETSLDGGYQALHILSLSLEPKRCPFQYIDGEDVGTLATIACRDEATIDRCSELLEVESCATLCEGWSKRTAVERLRFLETYWGVRPSVTIPTNTSDPWSYENVTSGEAVQADFSIDVLYNEELSVKRTIITLFALQLSMTLFVLLGLTVLRHDAGRLVLGPLRRMLKIVAFYAKNPLSPPPQKERADLSIRDSFQKQNDAYYYDSDDETTDKQLGTFETEQLINAVTKITDLLRKCWGVAGAGIISSNLARQEGGLTTYFNPTVPGKAVYALFAFAVIDKFQSHLHALRGDIMILINDIAAVLHEEVYRWGYEESGQCNKNLGAAFLMVYRIGAVSEVLEKRERAEAVIFSGRRTNAKLRRRRRSRATGFEQSRVGSIGGSTRQASDTEKYSRSHVDNLDLGSLPGMRTFADRALIGLLKTFAGIHRDKVILNWNNDFRLGAGVGAASINLNFGMDAGWAVEGAVGSSYKIDATYLSPHVNMASRMMSATKQYGVFILLSQAVQKLLSQNAQDKLRHIDTVTVKGSSVQQRIYTYDARARNDFFLYSKSESQADLDSERYSTQIWNMDQDLVAMRSHISDEFMDIFNRGREEYLAGNWPEAIKLLKSADKIMFSNEVEEGYTDKSYSDNLRSLTNIHDDDDLEAEERLSMGDGPCQRLIAYMRQMGGEAPDNWRGYRPLTSK